MQHSTYEALAALGLGFAFAGLVASSWEMIARRPLGFAALKTGDAAALASVPILVFSAPMIIVRNTLRGRRQENRPVASAVAAGMVAAAWSLLCGRLVLDAARFLTGA